MRAGGIARATAGNGALRVYCKFDAMLRCGVVLVAVIPAFVEVMWPQARSWARSGAFAFLILSALLSLLEVANLGVIYGH